MSSINQEETIISNDTLQKIKQWSRLIKTLIQGNKKKVSSNIDPYSIIINVFNEFYHNVHVKLIRFI